MRSPHGNSATIGEGPDDSVTWAIVGGPDRSVVMRFPRVSAKLTPFPCLNCMAYVWRIRSK